MAVILELSIDLSKASDSANHTILLKKLLWHNVDPRWFWSYLVDWWQVVKGGSLSISPISWHSAGIYPWPHTFQLFPNDHPSNLPHGWLISYAYRTLPSLMNWTCWKPSRKRLSRLYCPILLQLLENKPCKTTLLFIGTNKSLQKHHPFISILPSTS